MEKERDLALKEGYKSPICQTKTETDQNFDNCIDLMFDNLDMIDFFVASHNENSNSGSDLIYSTPSSIPT